MKYVLIAEDNELQGRLLWELLNEEGIDARIAEDGLEALKLLREKPYDLIVSDASMPKMDGYELANRVKHDEKLKAIPFIMYSSRPTIEGMQLAYENKVDKYLQEAGTRGVLGSVLSFFKNMES